MIFQADVQILAVSLLSGLIGAVIGGLISYKGTMNAAKTQIDHLYLQEKEKRKWDEKGKNKEALQAFYIETKENLESIVRWNQTHDYFRFGIEAWDLYKYTVKGFNPELVYKLIRAYSEMRRHNTSIDYHIELLANAHEINVGVERNLKQSTLEDGVPDVKVALDMLNSELINILDVIPPVKFKPKK